VKPGIVLVCDPRPGQAQTVVAGMLDALGALPTNGSDARGSAAQTALVAGTGVNWSAAAVSLRSNEPGRGVCLYTDGCDVLIWAGEVFLPSDWQASDRAGTPHEAISDAVLRQLQTSGIGALREIDGSFCGGWYERERRRWTIFTDKLGLVPVFYAAGPDRLIVGPKAWLTWQAVGEPLTINSLGVADLLRCENMVDDHTLIGGVNWLKGGHALRWTPGQSHTERYWDFRYADSPECDREQAVDRYISAFQQTMQRHTTCDAPLLLGISGGLDSRMLLGMCRQLGRTPTCFTAGWRFSDDVRYSGGVTRAAGMRREWIPLDEEGLPDRLVEAIVATDGLHSVAHMAPLSAIKAYLHDRTGGVLLEGYMQGVLGGAYVPRDEDLPGPIAPHQTQWARYRLHGGGDPETINWLLAPVIARESLERWRERIDTVYRQAPTDDPLARAEYTAAAARSGRIDALGTAWLREDVWVRCPACDRAMIEWHAATPPRLRRAKQLLIEVILRQFPALARVPRTACSGLPISGNRWLREYCWQKEKLHRLWTGWRHPWTHQLGTNGHAIRAWTFATWQAGGGLNLLLAPNARVLDWVVRDALTNLWQRAVRDPLEAGPILSLATIEIMIRHLERLRPGLRASPSRLRFRDLKRCVVDESSCLSAAAVE
jgi:hypothetical protein